MSSNTVLMNCLRLRRKIATGFVCLLASLLPSASIRAEVTSEVLITDRSNPPTPARVPVAFYDLGDGGECARAYKVIGKVIVRMKAPLDDKMIGEKVSESDAELRKVGASGLMITDFTINKYSANGYVDSATLVYTVIRYTDEPRLDLRTETDFKALLRAKASPAPIEGIWVDQATAERVAFFEDPAQKGRFLGVQFDVGNETQVPKGLIVADLRLEDDGWLVGHVMFDDFTRHRTKFKMRPGDGFNIPVKVCSNSYFARSYPDKFPPEYRLLNVTYVRQPLR
jgi:hypothetical protein